MNGATDAYAEAYVDAGPVTSDRVVVYTRRELIRCPHWSKAFARERKDHRYYELIEDTLRADFDFRYFAIKDGAGSVRAVQPFFILDQDLLAGLGCKFESLIRTFRRLFPRFMRMRTLMIGCAAGEGHLDAAEESSRRALARALARAVIGHARNLRTPLVVLKEFPAKYRVSLGSFLERGFTRVPSLPMTRLNIDYSSFEDYMNRALNSATRTKLRRKFRAAMRAPSIEMSVVKDITPIIDEIFPLYLNVYNRSKLHFEKLTREYFCGLSRMMPDKTRFFVWRQNERIVAFAVCMIEEEAFHAEYIGLDYAVAIDLHLYHYAYRDMISWAIANGYKEFRSSGLNYDPKLHLRHRLAPIDLYVRHTSAILNAAFKFLLPLLEPTKHEKTLPKFANYHELWEGVRDR
jgi:peptidoglycan biosynthesis/recognition FemAB-like protein